MTAVCQASTCSRMLDAPETRDYGEHAHTLWLLLTQIMAIILILVTTCISRAHFVCYALFRVLPVGCLI